MKLGNAQIYRGGVTSPYRSLETKDVHCRKYAKLLELNFKMSSKGGGYTDVRVRLDGSDFKTVLQEMCKVDRQAALEAMSSELQRQIGLQPGFDDSIRQATARRISGTARDKYYKAPLGDDADEKLVKEAVEEIISELGLA